MAGALRLGGGAAPPCLPGQQSPPASPSWCTAPLSCRFSTPQPADLQEGHAPRVRRAGVWIAVAFLADSAISSWSSIYLTQLGLVAAAPLGYGLYQLIVAGRTPAGPTGC